MCGSIETYDELLPLVRDGRRIIRYDWGGAGMSQKRHGTLTMDTLTGDLFGLLDALDVKGPVAIAGMAVGGAISLSAAAKAPDRIKAVVAMSPSTWIDPARKPVLLENIAKIEANGIMPTREASMNGNYPPALRKGDNDEKFARYRARWAGNDPFAYTAVYRMLINLDMDAALASIKCPVLVLGGEHDGVRPIPLMQKVASQIPGAQFKTTPGGHVMALQTPREVADAMNAFLKPLDL
jgi:3-oxoadipate enol-lactonase